MHSVCQFVYRGIASVVWRTRNNGSEMLSQPVRRFACQFVYRGTVGAIFRPRNNGGPSLIPPAREPAIQNVARYRMQNLYMLYKISWELVHALYDIMSILYSPIIHGKKKKGKRTEYLAMEL
jgi:hypothetical protein